MWHPKPKLESLRETCACTSPSTPRFPLTKSGKCPYSFLTSVLLSLIPPSLQDGSYGDLVITFKVVVPKTISSKQREVLEQFKAEEVEPSGAEPNGRGHRQRY